MWISNSRCSRKLDDSDICFILESDIKTLAWEKDCWIINDLIDVLPPKSQHLQEKKMHIVECTIYSSTTVDHLCCFRQFWWSWLVPRGSTRKDIVLPLLTCGMWTCTNLGGRHRCVRWWVRTEVLCTINRATMDKIATEFIFSTRL